MRCYTLQTICHLLSLAVALSWFCRGCDAGDEPPVLVQEGFCVRPSSCLLCDPSELSEAYCQPSGKKAPIQCRIYELNNSTFSQPAFQFAFSFPLRFTTPPANAVFVRDMSFFDICKEPVTDDSYTFWLFQVVWAIVLCVGVALFWNRKKWLRYMQDRRLDRLVNS
eukprot:TRINITY_DN1637_c0_g1_i1.p1 TRINITY_DN1637_c0_g1~~TRINITY_DN1637_c0_g1_i1.p1  ORF type:complete len:166 (+),score=14.04 TRINITY_DN1637_c0_g1_i1:71-568(+)